MSGFLSAEELKKLKPAERLSFASPIPTQIIASDEFFPARQGRQQREVEARLKEMGTNLARKQGMSKVSFRLPWTKFFPGFALMRMSATSPRPPRIGRS